MNESHIEKLRRAIAAVDADLAATQKDPAKESEPKSPEPSLAQPDAVPNEKVRFFQTKKSEMESAKAAYQTAVENKNSAEMAIHHAKIKELEGEIRNNSGDAPGANEYLAENLNDIKDIDRYWGKKRPAKKPVAQAQTPQPADPRPEAPAPEPRAVEPAPRETEPATQPVTETAPTPAPAPERPHAPEAPAPVRTPEHPAPAGPNTETLNRAREAYIKAQRRLRDASGVRGKLTGFMSNTSREALDRELDTARAEYERAFAEYAAEDRLRVIEEQKAIAEARLQELYPDKKGNVFQRTINKVGNAIVEGYKALGRKNLESVYKGDNRFIKAALRTVSPRTAILLGLGAGIGAGALAAGAGVGTAVILRRAFSGGASAIGIYAGLMGVRERNIRKNLSSENLRNMDMNEVTQTMAQMEALIGRDTDKIEKLRNDQEYMALQARYAELMANNAELNIEQLVRSGEEKFNQAAKDEVKARRWRKGIAIAAGATIGPVLGKVIKGAIAGIGAEFSPSGNSVASAADTHLPSRGDIHLPAENTGLDIDVGKRGIEGALLDLKQDNPERYKSMIEWLKQQDYNKGVTDEGALVHRWALDFAKDHNFEIDSGSGKDLSRILADNGLQVKTSGEIIQAPDKISFMGPKEVPVESATKQINWNVDAQEAQDAVSGKTMAEQLDALKESTADVGSESNDAAEQARQNLEALKQSHDSHVQAELEKSQAMAVEALRELEKGGAEYSDSDSASAPDATANTEALAEAREAVALGAEKTSQSLNLLLGRDYNPFLKETLHMSASKLDALKGMTYGEFTDKLVEDESFRKNYGSLAEAVGGRYGEGVDVKDGTARMRDVIFEMAKKYQNIK